MLKLRLKLPSASQVYITRYPTAKDSCQVSDNHYSVHTHPHPRPETFTTTQLKTLPGPSIIAGIYQSNISHHVEQHHSFFCIRTNETSRRQRSFVYFSSPPMKLYRRPKQTDPPGARRKHLPLKPTASSCVTSPQERRVGSLIVFTRPSRNLAAPNDTGAGRHQSLPALHLPGKRETSRRIDSFTENSSGR